MLIGVLEDDGELANLYSTNLILEGHDCHVFNHPVYFVRDVLLHHYDAIICDYNVAGSSNGADVIEEIRQAKPELPALIVSGIPLTELSQVEQRLGNVPTLQKPISIKKIIEIAEELTRRERIQRLKSFVMSSSR